MGAELLIETIARMADGTIAETPQDESLVTYAPRLERLESQVDWARPAAVVDCQLFLHPVELAAEPQKLWARMVALWTAARGE
jgi:methionyl-tRNA formyltransferase